MVRAPCCEKMGLKKGPWTSEEDRILVSHITNFGHGNWRALPKQAGLLRCGKSCRLRWTNYLRPDIKRGNFTREEEEMIINLHEILGNRWSAIAAKLPGRTDNEIKNVWHTHLKKRLNSDKSIQECKQMTEDMGLKLEDPSNISVSPGQSYSDISSSVVTTRGSDDSGMKEEEECMDSLEGFPEIEDCFWSDALMPVDDYANYSSSSLSDPLDSLASSMGEDMSYWLKVFMEA